MKKTSITIKISPLKRITYVMGSLDDVFDKMNASAKVREGIAPNSFYLERHEGENIEVIGIYDASEALLTEFLCFLTQDIIKQTEITV